MNIVLRNTLAVLVGFAAGSVLNMSLIFLSPHVIPPPAGVDVSKVESMKASMHLFQPKHFLFPFLAHAVGAFGGALVAYLIAGSRRAVFAYVIGCLFLAGGIAAAQMIPAPTWFIVVDLVGAYLPMAWLATRLGQSLRGPTAA
jgi:hypothetical protein